MRRALSILFLAVSALVADAAELITVTVTITNAPIGNTNTLTVNGDVRTWTNSITASPGTLIQETNSVPYSTTNLINHITAYVFTSGHILNQSASNNVRIKGLVGQAMAASLAGNWGFITLSTQQVTTPTFIVRVPNTVEADTNQTNIASMLATYLNLSTNALATNSTAGSNYLTKGASPLQRVTGPVQFSGQLGSAISSLTNALLINATNRGYVVALTNGYWTNGVLGSPTTTNLVNYGNAISSPGTNGTASEQFGTGAIANEDSSLAVGNAAMATAAGATAVGQGVLATNYQSSGFAAGAIAGGTNSLALGVETTVTGHNGTGVGSGVSVSHDRSTGVGYQANPTTNDQVRLGNSSATVSIPGVLAVAGSITNSTFRGTNVLNGGLIVTPRSNTSLVDGYNSGVVLGTNVYIRLSGPAAAYTNAGFAAEPDGAYHILQFDNPTSSMTILDNSGLEAAAANRIRTGTGALANFTNNPVILRVIYDGAASRWRILEPMR